MPFSTTGGQINRDRNAACFASRPELVGHSGWILCSGIWKDQSGEDLFQPTIPGTCDRLGEKGSPDWE
jgi:hypothetical protein